MTDNTQPPRKDEAEKKNADNRNSPKMAPEEARRNTIAAEGEGAEDHLGATETQIGDRTGSGAGFDQPEHPRPKPRKSGVA